MTTLRLARTASNRRTRSAASTAAKQARADLQAVIETAEKMAELAAEFAAAHPDGCACPFCDSHDQEQRELIHNSVRTLSHMAELVANDLRCLAGIAAVRPLDVHID